MPHTFFPGVVAFLSVVTEKDRSPAKTQILAYFNFSLISEKKKEKKIKRISNTTATKTTTVTVTVYSNIYMNLCD